VCLGYHCCVTSPCASCISAVHGRTQRKHFHLIVAWRMYWNIFTEPLPSSALSKSVTVSLNQGNIDCLQLLSPLFLHWYCYGFDQTIARQQLCKHVQTCNNRGISSLLSSDSVNILAAANADNNSEYIIITCYWATER
jgi:hypothetical protein